MTKSINLLFLLLPCFSLAQTFSGTFNQPIPDDGTVGYYDLPVSGLPMQTSDSFGVETVCINLTHTWNADLVVSLIAPDGTEAELTSDNGGDTDGYINTCFNASAAQGIWEVGWPYTGTFKPEGFMSVFQNGLNPNGTWRLKIRDTYPFADAGELFDWSVTFGPNPPTPYPFFSSSLPILKITTNGQVIPNEVKITATLQIIDNPNGQTNFVADAPNGYDGQIAIEQRGNSSGWMPKKSFNFETQQADGSNNNASLLGMPAENDWVLLANYSDKTLMRNFLAQNIFEKMGRYGVRMRHCELVIDGEYRGIYVLGERIKRDSQRVDIAKLDPDENTGEDVTGGYIIKIDWQNGTNLGGFSSQFPAINNANPLYYQFHYPQADAITTAQAEYIASYVDSFEQAMHGPNFQDPDLGWRRFAGEGSFTDFILLYELSNNVDAYWLSTFLHKDKNGKLRAGPPWDFDLAFNNADYSEGWSTSGWRHDWLANNTDLLPFFWQRIWQDTAFAKQAACRWHELREGALHPDSLKAIIAEKELQLEGPQMENFTLWDIIGVWVWPNVQPLPQSYEEEISRLQSWVASRAAWMDANLPLVDCSPVSAVSESEGGWGMVEVAPNPFTSQLRVSGPERFDLCLTNALGEVVWQAFDQKKSASIDTETLLPGCYWLTGISEGRTWSRLVIKH